MKKYKLANKDHFHFTNECFECRKDDHDDSAMVAFWVTLNGYPEPHYICTLCAVKIPLDNLIIDSQEKRTS